MFFFLTSYKLTKYCFNKMFCFLVSTTHYLTGETSIQYEVMINGPVEAGFIVYEDFFSYKSGKQTHNIIFSSTFYLFWSSSYLLLFFIIFFFFLHLHHGGIFGMEVQNYYITMTQINLQIKQTGEPFIGILLIYSDHICHRPPIHVGIPTR